jgi:NDP-sugar pyrophosphorylase family protein
MKAMRAMVLAAGLGTRLRPLTNDRPKALVEVAGRTLLDLTLVRLRQYGIDDVIVNTHHFADKVADYLAAHKNFGMNIALSREETLLDTGGGLKQASWFFQDPDAPFLLHNVDVLSNVDLAAMLRHHTEHNALATLATQHRPTSRYLLFDQNRLLCGRQSVPESGEPASSELVREVTHPEPLAFAGIHIISPRIFAKIHEQGAFSIIPTYLRLVALGEPILAFNADPYQWRDLGTPASVHQATQDIQNLLFDKEKSS